VISERPITRSEIVLNARVVGGIQMVDDGEADDKIIALLDNDPFWSSAHTVGAIPKALMERITHYFLTYKLTPGTEASVTLAGIYDREHAQGVVKASMEDYLDAWGEAPPTLRF
jgi:inorganic pyrophosphatase